MAHLLDLVISVEMLVGSIAGVVVASLIGLTFRSGPITILFQVGFVGLGLGFGVVWTILSIARETRHRKNL